MNQSPAHHFFPQGDAVGDAFTVDDPSVKGEWQIVGVVRDAQYDGPREKPERMTYLAVSSSPAMTPMPIGCNWRRWASCEGSG